jgi:signal peptidase
MRDVVGKWAGRIGNVILTVLVCIGLLIIVLPLFGWHVGVVLSGSMEPALQAGGVVVSYPVDAGGIEIGDIITYRSRGTANLISHRVIAIETSPQLAFITRGDANEDPDPSPIPAEYLAGKVCLHLPYLGYLFSFIRTPLGLVSTIVISAIIFLSLDNSIVQSLRKRLK